MTHTTDRNGHLLEAIWELNDRFKAGDDDALDMMFRAVHHYGQGRQEEERLAITKWLRALDAEGGEINRFLPTTLANWIEEGMHKT